MPFRRPPARLSHGLMATVFVLGLAAMGPSAAQPAPAASAAASPESAEIQRLIRDGQHPQALKLIDEALAKNPRDAQMRFRRGVALSMLDRKAEALAVFQKLVDDHPDMPAPYNNIAVILGAQGDYEKARQALEKAIRTNPAYATAYQNLGDVYAQLASQAYTKALQLDKADASVPPKLALLRELTAGANTSPLPAPPAAAKPASPPPPAAVAAAAPTAPAPAVAPAVKPAAASAPPVALSAAGTSEVEAAVRSWAAAWSQRDMPAYFAAYAPDFRGQTSSRKAWEQDRHARIAARKRIKVGLSDLRISVDGDQATAKFRQSYASDALSSTSRKTLHLVRTANGRWLIRQEAVGG